MREGGKDRSGERQDVEETADEERRRVENVNELDPEAKVSCEPVKEKTNKQKRDKEK